MRGWLIAVIRRHLRRYYHRTLGEDGAAVGNIWCSFQIPFFMNIVSGFFHLLGYWIKDNIRVLGACGRNTADSKVVNNHILNFKLSPCSECCLLSSG